MTNCGRSEQQQQQQQQKQSEIENYITHLCILC